MSILDANADSLRATALNSYSGPSKPPEPGVFSNFLPGAGSYFMRGMAESGRALSMAGAAVPVLADKLIGSDNQGESFGDRYFRWHDETFGLAVDYWTPKPGEVGAAGQVVGSLAAGLTQFLANPALLIGTAQLSTAEDLVRQGVDSDAALVAGDVAGLSTVAGIALPIFGKTLAGKIATGAAGNFATNIPEAAIKRAIVQASGAPAGVAEQFNPWDVRARAVDVLMGVAFGAKSHIDARAAAKSQAFMEGDIPSRRTAIADAAAKGLEPPPMTATQRDAIMVMNAARHLDEAALPWRAGEAEHTAAVDNVRTAVEQISRGQAVDVPPLPSEDFVTVWHGSPHKFDAFDASKIGTGEGNHAQGVGLYFADAKDVGEHYSKMGDNGYLYKVDIPDSIVGKMLDRDLSFADQKDLYSMIASKAKELSDSMPTPSSQRAFLKRVARGGFSEYDVDSFMNQLHYAVNGSENASRFLQSAGIPGFKYLDGGSRASGEGSYNYVVFPGEEGNLRIHERNGEAVQLAEAIAEAAPKSAEPVAAPEMRVQDVERAMKTAQTLSATIDAASTDAATRARLLKSEVQRLRSTADTAPTPDIAAHAKMAADMLENRAVATQEFPEDLRVPSGEFDPKTGDPLTISANEYVAKAAAEAEHVKATAEGLMRTVATCILGGI